MMSVYHLRDIISGNRTMLKSKEIKHISVPVYESLSMAKMLEWAQRHPAVFRVLPAEQSEIDNLHR